MEDENSQPDLGAEEKADAIADLLTGEGEGDEKEEESAQQDPPDEESEEEEAPAEDSEEEEESDDEEESDVTWESALGLESGQLSFDDDGNITGINVKVNGESSTVALSDLVKGYQTNKAVTQKSQQFAEERKQFLAQAEQMAEEFKNKLESADAMAKFLGDQLISEFNGIDWDKMRVENPAEYAAARQDYAARASQIREAQEALAAEKESVQKEQYNKQMTQRQNYLQEQRQVMLQNNPDWNDNNKFNADMDSMKSFLSSQYNFTEQDFASVIDARVIELVKDAKKFREGQSAIQKQVKKPVPKFQKSVGKTRKKVSKLEQLTKKAKSATGSNKRDLQAEAVSELLLGGT